MQFNMFEAGASKTPPKKPLNPSVGYPSNGDLSHGHAPTQLGAYWVHQLSEEFTALLKNNGITPSPDNLHQLADFFGGYTREMNRIRDDAREVGSSGRRLLSDIRSANSTFTSVRDAIQQKADAVSSKLARCENTLSEANSALADATAYTSRFAGQEQKLETLKADAQRLLDSHSKMAEQASHDLLEMTVTKSAVEASAKAAATAMTGAQAASRSAVESIGDARKAADDLTKTVETVRGRIHDVEGLVSDAQANAALVKGYRDEAAGMIETVRSISERVRSDREIVSAGAADVKRETQAAHSIVEAVNEAKQKVEALQAGFDDGMQKLTQTNAALQKTRDLVEASASSAGGALSAVQAAASAVGADRSKVEASAEAARASADTAEKQAVQARQSGDLAKGYADDARGQAVRAEEAARQVTWDTLPGKPDLSSLGSDKAVPRAGNRGFLNGYQTVETSKKSTLVIKKDSPDVQAWSGEGDFLLTCFPAGEDEYAVKVVHLKATGATALRLSGTRWSDETPPDWGSPGETLTLTLCFIGGIVIAGVYSIRRTK